MAYPQQPTNLKFKSATDFEVGQPFVASWYCGDPADTSADAVTSSTIVVSQTDGGAPVYSETVTTRTGQLSTWQATVQTTGLVAGTCHVEVYGTNSTGIGPAAKTKVQLYDPPTVAVTTPANGSTLTSTSVTMAWTASDVTGISAQSVAILHGADVIYSADVSPYARTHAVPSSVTFTNNQQYEFQVTAKNGKYIDATASSTASFSFTPPKLPSLSIVAGNGLTADITVAFGTGTPATVSVDVMRVNPDGTIHVIAEGLANGATVTDPLPPLGAPGTWRAVAHASSGSTAYADIEATIATRSWALNYGSDASGLIELAYNPEASYSMSHGGELYHFADGGAGGGLPVWYGTTDRDESGSLRFATIMQSDADALRAAVMSHPVAWLRDPFGHRWRAHVELSWSHGVGEVWPVTLKWDAVRFEEV